LGDCHLEKKADICQYGLMASGFDKEKIKQIMSLVLEKIETEADPRMLREYERLFKKETSLFNRSKAAACLLMLRPEENHPGLQTSPSFKTGQK